jgi:protein-tyrosine phosphatase
VDSVIDMLKRQRAERALGGTPTQTDFWATDMSPSTECSDHTSSNLIDIDDSWLQQDSIDLIAKTVEDFRNQRLSMVQSLRQFVLCYETILEWMIKQPGMQPRRGGRERAGTLAGLEGERRGA